jgi:putative transposase
VNKNSLIKSELERIDEYFAVSVSESMLDKVRDYIRYQEEHHKRTTFKEEYAKFMNQYG